MIRIKKKYYWVPEQPGECQVCNINYIQTISTEHYCRACGKARKKWCSYSLIITDILYLLQLMCRLCGQNQGYFEDKNKQASVCDICYMQCNISGKSIILRVTVCIIISTITNIVDGSVLLEDSANENYYNWRYMIINIRHHKIRIYPNGVSPPLRDGDILFELDFRDIVKVIIASNNTNRS